MPTIQKENYSHLLILTAKYILYIRRKEGRERRTEGEREGGRVVKKQSKKNRRDNIEEL